jgi:hypothetical protein
MKASHDTRCERSATDPKRCRCDCQGRLHGVEATQRDLQRRPQPIPQASNLGVHKWFEEVTR